MCVRQSLSLAKLAFTGPAANEINTTEVPLQDLSPDIFVDCEEYYTPSPTGGGDYYAASASPERSMRPVFWTQMTGTAASLGLDHSRKAL